MTATPGGNASNSPMGTWRRFALQLRNNMPARAAVIVLGSAVVGSLASALVPALDPTATALEQRLVPPLSSGYVLGTDQLGRDLLSRLLAGTRLSLGVAALGVAVSSSVGSAIGLIAAYRGGWTDALLSRGIDVLMAFPYLLLALCIVAVLGPGLMNATLAIAVVNIPFFARTVRGQALAVAREPYIAAARVGGQTTTSIVLREILPAVLPVLAVACTTSAGWMIVETAGLSFLGLGAQPPTADLGGMLGQSRHLLTSAPHVCLIAGAMILLLVTALNVLGDAARDALDNASPVKHRHSAASTDPPALEPNPPNATQEPAAIEVSSLHVAFEGHEVVTDVSFSIAPGQRVGLVGESGSGKSVTARAIFGSLSHATVRADRLHLGGVDLRAAGRVYRGRHIGWIPQDPLGSLHPLQTIGTQLRECMTLYGSEPNSDQRRLEALAEVGIADPQRVLNAYPHELSGGMRQRVAVAIALTGDPTLVIADEPTTALDVTTQAMVLDLLRRVTEQHAAALLFITHDLAVVRQLCDHVLVMNDGTLVERGPTDAVLAAPDHDYTRRLIGAIPQLGRKSKLFTVGGAAMPSSVALQEDR